MSPDPAAPQSGASALAAATPAGPVKNLIVMIADGAGYNTLEATRLYLNALPEGDPRRGAAGSFLLDEFGFVVTAQSTYPLDVRTAPIGGQAGLAQNPLTDYNPAENYDFRSVAGTNSAGYLRAFEGYEWNRRTYPDSANTASSISNGEKTYNNALNVDGNGQPVLSTAEIAHAQGKATGVVSTVQLSDATPAASGGAHNASRANRTEVAAEMFRAGILDVIAGTGNPDYNDDGQRLATPSYVWIGQDVWTGLKDGSFASNDGGAWTLLQDRAAIVAAGEGTPVDGRLAIIPQAFTGTNFYRSGASPAGATEIPFSVPALASSPTLTEMTRAALNKLGQDPDGFYVSIEAGSVDRAMHANNFGRMIEEYIEFNDAIRFIIDYINSEDSAATFEDTLLIVTADHDHLLFGPEGATIPFQAVQPDRNGDGVPEYAWFSNNHSNQIVPLYAYGAAAQGVAGLADDLDVVRDAGGTVVAGSGQAFTDQAELGNFLIRQLRLGDTLVGTEESDRFVGGAGLDYAAQRGERGGWSVERTDAGGIVLVRGQERDVLEGIERVVFDDAVLDFDRQGGAAKASRLYDTLFDRVAEQDGLTYWARQAELGLTALDLAQRFLGSAEGGAISAALDDRRFAQRVFENALDRDGAEGGVAYYAGRLADGSYSRARVLAEISESEEHLALVAGREAGGIALYRDVFTGD